MAAHRAGGRPPASGLIAVHNTSVKKHSRETGAPSLQFAGAEGGPLIHMDSGAVHRGLLYAAHSNYNESPIESPVEVFDAVTIDEPVVAVCLYYSVDHPTLLDPDPIFLRTEAQRRAIVEQNGAHAATEAWNFSEWIPGLEAELPDDLRSDEFVERERRLVRELADAGCENAARYVLNRVARVLMRHDSWPFPTGEPFVIYVFDDSFGDRLVENLAFVCDERTRELLVIAGLWPGDVDRA